MRKSKPKAKSPRKPERVTNKKAFSVQRDAELNKEFLDMIAPTTVQFQTGEYLMGNTWRCVWALREYPVRTESQALLKSLGEKAGVTLHQYIRPVTPYDERRILSNADKANKMKRANTENLQDIVQAESNLQDVAQIITNAHRNKEPFLHHACYIELCADTLEHLTRLQDEVASDLTAARLEVDKLRLRQQEGFQSVMPTGWNVFGEQFERVLPASSVANLYPFAYSGKCDPQGFFLGHDKYGSNIIVDLNRRAPDKTNACALVLGNSGMGKSYLLKLLMVNALLSGKSVILLDPEAEYRDLVEKLGGCYLDLTSGEYIINVLEPKRWTAAEDAETDAPAAFQSKNLLSQHISFLRDFFSSYKTFDDAELDTLEMLLGNLYAARGITDESDFTQLSATDYPTLGDLYEYLLQTFHDYQPDAHALYTGEQLRSLCLGLRSLCKGADSKMFDGHTNVTSHRLMAFGVKNLLDASKTVKDAMLFNVLSYMSGQLLSCGNTVAVVDELYLFLSNPVAIEYIRNAMKRVRKKESAIMLATQNIEDFLMPGVAEMTKPLFAIPTHQFLFHPGSIPKETYLDTLQLAEHEYEIVLQCRRGICLYKCGAERYQLIVQVPDHKAKYFGNAGGR